MLEALAEQLPGAKLDKVRSMLKRLQIGEPDFNGVGLVRRAYDVRNDFMHHGKQLDLAEGGQLRQALSHLVAFVLRHTQMIPLSRQARQQPPR